MTSQLVADHRSTIAVIYVVSGAEGNWFESTRRFATSYKKFPAGREHSLYTLYKGFQSEGDMDRATELLSAMDARTVKLDDDGLDIGAYRFAVNEITEDRVCFLNTDSELMGSAWLNKLALHLDRPNVGLVGVTGSFESLLMLGYHFSPFPNVHLRSSGIMIDRELFTSILRRTVIRSELDAFYVESSSVSLTRQVLARGLEVLLVGRNGRGYPPRCWPSSDTFRQGSQANLLIGDNQTRAYIAATWNTKRNLIEATWGEYYDPDNAVAL